MTPRKSWLITVAMIALFMVIGSQIGLGQHTEIDFGDTIINIQHISTGWEINNNPVSDTITTFPIYYKSINSSIKIDSSFSVILNQNGDSVKVDTTEIGHILNSTYDNSNQLDTFCEVNTGGFIWLSDSTLTVNMLKDTLHKYGWKFAVVVVLDTSYLFDTTIDILTFAFTTYPSYDSITNIKGYDTSEVEIDSANFEISYTGPSTIKYWIRHYNSDLSLEDSEMGTINGNIHLSISSNNDSSNNFNNDEVLTKLSEDKEIIIYPNPVSSVLNIQNEHSDHYAIYSMMGKKLINDFENSQINISNLPNGHYFLIDQENGITKNFIISH